MPDLLIKQTRRSARSLGAYLALAFSLLSIVLTLLLGEVVERAATREVESGIGHSLAELAMQTTEKLDRGMFERYREVGLMAQRADLTDAAAGIGYRREALTTMQKTYGYYSWVGMTDLQGKVVVAARGVLEGADVSKRPWFRDAFRDVHVGDVHDAILLAKLTPKIDGEPARFVDVAFPYNGRDGKPAGVLGVHLSWQWAHDVERSVIGPIAARRQVEAVIVNSQGDVLLGPPALRGETIATNSLRAAQRKPGYTVETWPDGSTYLVGFAKSTGYAEYPGLGWTVLVRQNVDNAYEPVKRIRQKTVWGGVVLALLFSLVGWFGARRITRPLEQLAVSAQRIQAGDTVPLTPGRGNYYEFKALSGSLNALVSDLMQRKHELQDLNAHLEQRVEERTRELEQALVTVQANQQRIQAIIEAAQDVFIGVDLNGRVTDWNSQAQRMFGWSRDEVLGRPLADLVLPERHRASVPEALRAFHQTGRLEMLERRVERTVMNRRGVEFPVEVTAGLAATSETVFFSLFLHDISERKKIERMKSEFVSTVSHELRTPLTSIRASLAMLADGTAGDLPADVKALVAISYQSCERLVRMVNDVLDIQKIEAGSMEFDRVAQPLLPLVEHSVDVMRGYARQMEVALDTACEVDSRGAMAEVDHDRMTQVLSNLLSNAVKFSPQGGKVVVRLSAHGGWARVSVTDQGCGIPEEFRDRVFQRFAQADSADSRQKGGTGLGLSICKSIVEEHGGSISFDSEAGAGASFHVDLPLAG